MRDEIVRKAVWAFGMVVLFLGASRAQTRELVEDDFSPAAECGSCHQQIYEQWQDSAHARSATDPLYRAVFEKMIEQQGRRNQILCLSCHVPVGTATGGTLSLPEPFDWSSLSAKATEGVTCDFCHMVAGNQGLGRQLLIGGYKIPEGDQTPVRFGRHEDASTPAHPTRASKYLTSSEFCSLCHQFKHPVVGHEIQSTYDEWLESPAREQGRRCQDCHMPPSPGRSAPEGRPRPAIHAHNIRGPAQLLKDAVALALTGGVNRQEASRNLGVMASVTNSGAGHSMPTGLPGIRDLFLRVEVKTATSEVLETQEFHYRQRLVDGDGKDALPWEAFAVVEDTRLVPGETREELFELPLDDGVEGPLSVRAELLYQWVASSMSSRLDLPASPPMLIASQQVEVRLD